MPLPEVFSGVSRVKWWRYRYMLGALLLINAFAIHYFFLDQSSISLNPFRTDPLETTQIEVVPHPNESKQVEIPIGDEATKAPVEEVKPEVVEPPAESPAVEVKPETPVTPTLIPETPVTLTPTPGTPTAVQQNQTTSNATAKIEEPPAPPAPTKLQIPHYPEVKFDPPPPSKGSIGLSTYEFRDEYIGWPLGRVCSEASYTDGLYFECDNNSGGIGNIRNFILTCIRYAIEAGATGIVMPRIQRRAEDKLDNLFTSTFQSFDYFFDKKHFLASMNKYCPKITIYEKLADVPRFEAISSIKEFYPKDMINGGSAGDGCDDRGVNRHLDTFRSDFDKFVAKTMHVPNLAAPVSVRLRWATFFEWPIYRDGAEFATTFGDLLRFRHDIVELAAKTIDELVRIIHDSKDKPNRKILNAPYLGVHLRTEADALGFWPNFETQTLGYIEQAGTRGLKHAFIASGNASEGHRFGELALESVGMKVYGKTDLLHDEALENLNRLTWDQQALVDFLVLMKSAHFTGCSFSSFSMNLAIKRHTMTEGIKTRPWKNPGDVYSTLVGRFQNWFGDWLFMYECLWP